ncbi:MAG TPA: hypothetical protein VHY21_15900 [Pseudonocardiaceae bacterium]|nr:hypothetical protein [Pseudonocardiaceae bacterium]
MQAGGPARRARRYRPGHPGLEFSLTAPKTAAFWSRRMAHEVTVHRIDAQAAAGSAPRWTPSSPPTGWTSC